MIFRDQKSNEQSDAIRLNRAGNIKLLDALKTVFNPVIGGRRSKIELTGKLIPRRSFRGPDEPPYLLEAESRDYLLKLKGALMEQASSLEWDEVWLEGSFEDDPTLFVVERMSKATDESERAVRTVSF